MLKARTLLGQLSKLTRQGMEDKKLIWVDLEMTGLNIDVDHILEMSCVVTDEYLNSVSEPLTIVIHQPDHILKNMGEWCTLHHGKSGLTDECKASTTTLQQAEDEMLTLVQKHTKKGECPLAGNTIYMDKMFLIKHMPRFVEHLHYRLVDVSTIKELAKRWYPHVYTKQPPKEGSHRTLSDIMESIKELNYYREHLFR